MNIRTTTAFRRSSRNTLFAALLATLTFHAEVRPVLPLFFGLPESSAQSLPADTRLWRYLPIGPRGRYMPVEGSQARQTAPHREVKRWAGPHGSEPVYRGN